MARSKAGDHDLKRSNILSKAAELFTAEGFSRASMTQLSQACEISKSNLYHYYPDKESILYEILAEHMNAILNALHSTMSDEKNGKNRLESLIASLLQVYQDADHVHRILLNDLQILPQDKQGQIREKERMIVQYFRNAILLDYPNYASSPKMLSTAAMTILGAINWAFTWYNPQKGLDINSFAHYLAQTFHKGIGHYDPKQPSP